MAAAPREGIPMSEVANQTTDWPALLETLAREAEVGVLAKVEDRYAECVEEHARQTKGFGFSCTRHGDFLAIFISRDGNPEPDDLQDWLDDKANCRRRYSTTLNLAAVRNITLVEGHAPDRRGKATYSPFVARDVDGEFAWSGSGIGRAAPGAGNHYAVREHWSEPPLYRSMAGFSEESLQRLHLHCGVYDRSHSIQHETVNYARAAEDDCIHFERLGARIYAPAGQGNDVLSIILRELGRVDRTAEGARA